MLTDDELAVVRSWVGEGESEDDINARFERHFAADTSDRPKAVFLTVEETLRHQLAVLTSDTPSSTSAEGMSVSYVQNISTLREKMTMLLAGGLQSSGTGGALVSRLVRTDPR